MGLGTGGKRRLETLGQLSQARLIALGEPLETETGHGVEPLGGLDASQTKGWPACEGQQGARMTQELRDDLIGVGFGGSGGDPGGWAVGDRRLGLFERTRPQARHRQDAHLAGRCGGLLTEQVAHLLAHTLAQRTLACRLGLSERLSEVAQRVGLTELMATVGEHCGSRWHQARLLVTEHGEHGPLKVRERLQESVERRLILLAQPATSYGQATRQFADEPNLWLAPLGSHAVEGEDQTALVLGNLRQAVLVLPLMARQQR